MDKGTVLFHKNFRFSDGAIADKLLIILNTPKPNKDPYLCCRTTSKQKYNLDKQGCYSEKNTYVLNADFDFFNVKTWIQFNEIYEFKAVDFLNAHFNGLLIVKCKLRDNTINSIINCVRKSEDISKYHLSLL